MSDVESVSADGSYRGEPFVHALKELLGRPVEIAKRNQFHRFAVIPIRWGVEPSFAWLDRCHRL